MKIKDKDFDGEAVGSISVKELGAISRERERTKRFLIGAACLFFVIAAIVIVFAPAGKEKLSYILGAALIVMALGAIGASQFRFKLPGIEVDTKTNRDDHAPSISDNKSTSLESNVLKQNNFTSAV